MLRIRHIIQSRHVPPISTPSTYIFRSSRSSHAQPCSCINCTNALVTRRFASSSSSSSTSSTANTSNIQSTASEQPQPTSSSGLLSKMSNTFNTAKFVAKNVKHLLKTTNTFTKPSINASHRTISGTAASWNQAVLEAERLVHLPNGNKLYSSGSVINPKELLGDDLALLKDNIKRLVGSNHPVLSTVSNYYFSAQGKHIRPLIVLLMSKATASVGNESGRDRIVDINEPIRDGDVQFLPSSNTSGSDILPSHRRLAEITEMIHTASLLHDDVIDESATRRSLPSANAAFGNKMAILAGDFLLARASIALARMRNVEVVELMSTVISDLVEGEFMQLRNTSSNNSRSQSWSSASTTIIPLPFQVGNSNAIDSDFLTLSSQKVIQTFEYYLYKTYYKTASLIAKSCESSAVLSTSCPTIIQAANLYGKNLGLAFQLVDDILDFGTTEAEFGKPVNADLGLGIATAPVLYAAEEFPELWELIERNFDAPGDVEKARALVNQSRGTELTRQLAEYFCRQAIEALNVLPESDARTALIQLTNTVLTRRK